MVENKDINLIAIKSLIECIDNRDIAEGGIFLDDDNAEFVADILRYHYKSLTLKNKMAGVAQLFGKKLNEEFEIVTPNGRVRKVKFTTEHGLLYYDRIENEWRKNYGFLNFLCEDKAVIINE